MLISYWECKYNDCDDYFNGEEGHIWIYSCTHPQNKEKYCHLDNKWNCSKDNCIFLDMEVDRRLNE